MLKIDRKFLKEYGRPETDLELYLIQNTHSLLKQKFICKNRNMKRKEESKLNNIIQKIFA